MIFKHVLAVITYVYDTLIYLCPYCGKIIQWTLEHIARKFETKYTLIDDDIDEVENENEFNWWTKYYGFTYQKVIIF